MALPAQVRTLEGWARNAGPLDRSEPEDEQISRSDGWSVVYEQLGGKPPERTIFNQLLYEISMMLVVLRNGGLPAEWDISINYPHRSWVRGKNGVEYITRRNTGPRWGNAADPTTQAGSSSWRRY